MLTESQKEGNNLNRLTNKAVYLLCWFKRYIPNLLSNWKMPEIACFIHMGECKNENEAMFLSFLARLPVDVLILNPNLNAKCCLEDKLLYEVNYQESLSMTRYPEESSQVRIGTVAYHAERELDTLMYQDSGIYRNQQYGKANVICLQTMYEEIKILWDQELKYRPNFSTVDGVVNIPVIGLGGIMNWKDAVEFMLAGASAIQIGTANFIDPAVTIKVEDGINNYLERHGCKSVKEIIGALEV